MMMMEHVVYPSLEGKVCWISGGASGIGRASAMALAESKAIVVVADLDHASGNALVELIAGRGGRASFSRADVLDDESVRASIEGAAQAFGRLDVVVNSAGRTSSDRYDDFERNVDMFLLGTWRAMRAALPLLQSRYWGTEY